MRFYLRSKIHRATVTLASVDYIGSITLDSELIERAGFEEGEKVSLWDVTNGERVETYIIKGVRNSGIVCINGAAAKKIKKGDIIIIAGFEMAQEKVTPKIVLVDKNNKFVKYL